MNGRDRWLSADLRFDVLIRTAFVSVSLRTRQRPNPCVSFENPVADGIHSPGSVGSRGGGTQDPRTTTTVVASSHGNPPRARVGAEKGNRVQATGPATAGPPPSGTEFGGQVRQIGWTVIRLGPSSSFSSDALVFKVHDGPPISFRRDYNNKP